MDDKTQQNDDNGALESVTDPKSLIAVYKKNGTFDRQRKSMLENFKKSETHSNLLLKLKLMVENKIKNDPTILTKNRGKMAALIQGGIINEHMQQKKNSKNDTSLLSIVDKDIQEKIIDSPEFHDIVKTELKDIKRRLLGISDEDYAKQLEEEKRNKELELEKLRKEDMEREYAYKNNFKIKNLNTSYKVTKVPRFNISLNRNSFREDDSGLNGHNGAGSSKSGSENKSKDVKYLMY